MKPPLKPVPEQVIVITGATSGIGLTTARTAAAEGARLVLAARNQEALIRLVGEIRAAGGQAEYVVADVADPDQVEAVAARAEAAYGGFDTWINDAAAAHYGTIESMPLADQRRIFEVNYWGLVYGTLAAVRRLRTRPGGGAIINLGSVLSDQAIPIQGVYSASKHAVKGFTNALRMELIKDAPDISLTLIKPSAIDTPYREHARNYLAFPAANPQPVYDPQLVADAILHAAENRVRELTIGGAGKMMMSLGQLAPGLAEPIFAWLVPALHRQAKADPQAGPDNLHTPGRDGKERTGGYPMVRQSSLYLRAQMNPQAAVLSLMGVAVGVIAALTVRDQLRLAAARRAGRDKERAKLARRSGNLPGG